MDIIDNVEEISQKVYNHIKDYIKKHEFAPTTMQISSELQLKEYQVKEALDELEKSERIVITRIPEKTIIEFKK